MYLYKAITYHTTTNVASVPVNNTTDNADFVNNYKASAIKVDSLELAETTFVTELSYTDFKAEVAQHTSWSNVKYVQNDKSYTLYLISSSSLI
jgi:hypothetical protein